MKKSLLAVAALGAFASAAQAQSSVTVYGILDVGYVGGNQRINTSAQTYPTKYTVNQFGESAEQTSRLGFKGVEDLGNGSSAFFTAEFALYPQDNNLSGNTTNGLQNRQTFVGLKKNGIGQTAVGLQYTPIFNAQAVTDPGMNNNMVGNVIYVNSSGKATSTSGSLAPISGANNAGFTNRTANTLSVQSDTFSGFRASAMYTLNAQAQNQVTTTTATTGGTTNATGWGLGAEYTYNKFYINAAYQALKQLTTASNTQAGLTTATAWGQPQANGSVATSAATGFTSTTALNTQDNQFFAGATYDFGILKAYAQYLNRKVTATANSGYYLSRSAEQIGVRSYITPTIEAWASGGLGRYTEFGSNNPAANFNAWQLGSNYWLSKRTNLYAIYGQTLTSTSNITYANGVQATVSGGASNYAIGVRHTF
jgi:predicted porin